MVEIEKLLLRRQDVEAITGLSKSQIYVRMNAGEFPQPLTLADRLVRWVADEVREWVADRIRDSRPQDGALPHNALREYWANHRAAKAAEKSPAVSAKPPRKPTHPPPKANGPRPEHRGAGGCKSAR